MKIPLLLVQYLYNNRKMSLPGLGIFTLDKSVVLPEENDRALLSLPNAVQFQNANIASADKELISFICENTGKIRPLAISDLESYLNLGTEMLNIGKPFYLEGIGTITKNKAGKFDFAPGEYTLIKENMSHPDGDKRKVYARDKNQSASSSTVPNRNGLVLLGILAAIIIVGLGGWLMYKKNSPSTPEVKPDTGASVQEPISSAGRKDSVQLDSANTSAVNRQPSTVNSQPSTLNTQQPTNYKWVILATHNKAHAIKRYHQLFSFDTKTHLFQEDSLYFKVYFQFPALPRDTLHIKDSLRAQYAHTVTIEQ